MKKLFNRFIIVLLLSFCAGLISCGNGNLSRNDFPNDGKAYLLFSLQSEEFNNQTASRNIVNPQVISKEFITDVVLRAKGTEEKTKNIREHFEWKTENGVLAIDNFLNAKNITLEPGRYDFTIELYTADPLYSYHTDYIPDQDERNDDPHPVQWATNRNVIIAKGANSLSFKTEHYRKNTWDPYVGLLEFEYNFADISEFPNAYVEITLNSWPWGYLCWFNDHEMRWERDFADPDLSRSMEHPAIFSGSLVPDDGDYTLNIRVFDQRDRGNLIKAESDTVKINGYKTVVKRDVYIRGNTGSIVLPQTSGADLDIDCGYDLCVNHGNIIVKNTPYPSNCTAALYYGGEFLDVQTLSSGSSVGEGIVSWNSDIFAGKTPAANGEYPCQLFIKRTNIDGSVDSSCFNISVPDRTFVSYDFSDGNFPTLEENKDYYLKVSGVVDEQHTATWDDTLQRAVGAIPDFVKDNLNQPSLSPTTKVFLDLYNVTGETVFRIHEIELTQDVMLNGIILPHGLKTIEGRSFFLPFNAQRQYEMTFILNENLGAEVSGEDNKIDCDFIEHDIDTQTWSGYYFANPISKFIQNGNPNYEVLNDGLMIMDRGGWGLLKVSNQVEELSIPLKVGSLRGTSLAGNKKLKKVVDWGNLQEIQWSAFLDSGLEGVVEIGSNLLIIERDAFVGTNVTQLIIPESLKVIDGRILSYNDNDNDNAKFGYKAESGIMHIWNLISDTELDDFRSQYETAHPGSWWDWYNKYLYAREIEPPPVKGNLVIKAIDQENTTFKNYNGITNCFDGKQFWRAD
jgi:hypothetical protein